MSPRDLFPALLVLVHLIFLTAPHPAAADQPPEFLYYADIPGVTPAEIESIESLKRSRPEGLTYAMISSNTSFLATDGEIGGITRIFCEELSRLFGLRVTPRLAKWDVLIAGLDNHDFDLSGELTATPERRTKYRMSDPIMGREFTVFHHADRDDLDLINGKEPLRYGFLMDSVTADRVRATSAVPFTTIFLANIAAAAEAIQNDHIDAFISEDLADSHFDKYTGISYQPYYPLTYTSVSLATANPDLFPLIDVFQKYLNHGGLARMAAIRAEGELEYLRHKLFRQMNEAEREYLTGRLALGQAIPLAAEHDNYPVSFYNRREGRWQGIAHDVLAEITRLTGLEFEIINIPDTPWPTLQKSLESGEAALVTELVSSKNRQGRFLWSREPYMANSYALLSRATLPNMKIHQVFGSRVGFVRGSVYEEVFNRMFPGHSGTEAYANARAGFEALEKGEVDLVMMSENMLLSITHYRERPEFKVNVPLKLPSDAHFGFNANETELRGLMDKAQSLVNCKAIAEQWQRQTFDYSKKIAQARIPYLIGISALLLLVLALLLALSRKKERRSRHLSQLDHLTRLPNRRYFEERLRAAWDQAFKARQHLSLLALDIDHFKRLNDTYGHPQGDEVLRAVAGVFVSATERHTDLVARLGGEEFSALLPNTDLDGAVLVAEKMRAAVEATAFENIAGGPSIHITVSIGVASLKPRPGNRLQEVTDRSDQALYAAKQNGRNRVRVA